MNKANFQALVRRILTEEIQKRVPEMNGNGVDPEKKNKTFSSDPNSRDVKTKDEMIEELLAAAKKLDPTSIAVWDDHDDLRVNGRDIGTVWITPLWEDNYKIVYMPRNEDRFFFTGLTWQKVMEFVKDNLDQKHHYTSVEKGRDRVWRNQEARPQPSDKGLPQEDKPKVMSTDEPFTKEKNKEKRYREYQVQNKDDLPNKQMKEVGEFKRQEEHKVKDPVKLRKRIPDKKLVVKQS
jgi:hypothetical protein